jgi:predicted membrane protein
MIQRIQSIYLLLAGLGFGALFLLPFATSSKPIPVMMQDMVYNIQDSPLLLVLTIIGIVASITGIFLYGNRNAQQKITSLVVICGIFVPLVAALLIYNEQTGFDPSTTTLDDEAGIYMPVLSIIFGVLALRGIKKDENIVKSMDRLR